MVLFVGSKVKGQGHRVSKFILHTRTLHTRAAIHRYSLGGVTIRRSGFEVGIECLLVLSVCPQDKIIIIFVHLQQTNLCKSRHSTTLPNVPSPTVLTTSSATTKPTSFKIVKLPVATNEMRF